MKKVSVPASCLPECARAFSMDPGSIDDDTA